MPRNVPFDPAFATQSWTEAQRVASRSWSYHDSAPDAARRNRNNAAEAGRQYVVQRQRRMMERDRVMDVALPRGRIEIYWIAQTTARILAFGVALVAAICGAYLAAKWSNKKPEGAIALAANLVAMCIDGFVVSNLLIPSAPRISPSAIFCLDFLMFAAALTAGSLVAVSDQDENGTRPWTVILIITATFTILTSVLRIMFLTWSCFDCKRVKKTRQQLRRRREPAPEPEPRPAESNTELTSPPATAA